MTKGMSVENTRGLPVARTATAARGRSARGGAALGFVYLWWVLILFEPDWFLAGMIGGPWPRIPMLLTPGLLLILARTGNTRWVDWPFALFLLLYVIAIFYAENRGYVFGSLKVLLYIYATCAAVLALATTPARIVTLLKIYLLGFIWYGVQGLPHGLVTWHPLMSNEDSYGPFMVMGVGFAYNFAVATRSRRWRPIGYATAMLCCAGVVSSFARGAVLAFALVLCMMWLRARHKFRALMAGVAAIVVTVVAANVLFPEGEFWKEMRTISEGTSEGTGATRWISWKMGLEVFAHYPILGAGAGNFGVVASQRIPFDASRPEWSDPANLYNLALHNVYVELLCEEGLVGFALFAWMTIEFFRRLRRLRSASANAAWYRRGGTTDLRSITLALELAMVAFLANAFFYNQIYIHWFWTLITLAFALTKVALPSPARAAQRGARGR